MDEPETSTFLAALVLKSRLKPEPVATAALTHLFGRSDAARGVVKDLAHTLDPTHSYGGLAYSGEVVIPNVGRPDIVASDSTGRRVVIEAKFDAGLTDAQAGTGYVDLLVHGGILFYLIPRDRMGALWPKLLSGPCGHPPNTVRPAWSGHDDKPWLVEALGDGRVVVALPWEELLRRLHGALDGGSDAAATADLAQIHGLVAQQTRNGYVPLSPDDLNDRAGRQLAGLKVAVLNAAKEVSCKTITNGSNDWGPARWVYSGDGTRLFWVGLRIPTWGRLGHSPVWAVIVHKDATVFNHFAQALKPLRHAGGPGVFRLDTVTLGVPVLAPLGEEQGTVQASFQDQLKVIRNLLEPLGKPSDSVDIVAEEQNELS